MTETKITLHQLTASDGHVLTNGEVYGKKIYLGLKDKAENWHEITDAEYADIASAEENAPEMR